jgi:hypothetical protein
MFGESDEFRLLRHAVEKAAGDRERAIRNVWRLYTVNRSDALPVAIRTAMLALLDRRNRGVATAGDASVLPRSEPCLCANFTARHSPREVTTMAGPGVRPQYHPDYFAAFVVDPDEHRIEAVCHAPEKVWSSESYTRFQPTKALTKTQSWAGRSTDCSYEHSKYYVN